MSGVLKSSIVGLGLVWLATACQKEQVETVDPNEAIEARMGAGGSSQTAQTEEQRLDGIYGARATLAPRPEPTEQCDAEGKCTKVEPDPPLAAAHGVREFMTHFRWDMEPAAVLEQLAKEVRATAAENASSDPMQQDRQREELEQALSSLQQQHVSLSSPEAEPWSKTLLENLYSPEEELVWFGDPDLRRYYFFSDGKLWHIGYAYSKRLWPDKLYPQIVEEELMPRFGYTAEAREQRDERTGELLLHYYEWTSSDGETIRAYDLLEGHAVILVSVLRSKVEEQLGGQRFPKNELDAALRGGENLDDVLEAEGICYDDNGDMVQDREFCSKQKESK